jgi:hypothetical protein
MTQDDSRQHFVIHADNARPHCGKIINRFLDHNSLCPAPHPPHSPDFISSDFWLFGDLKRVFQGSSFDKLDELDELDELLSPIQEILSRSDRDTLDAVFQE